MRTAAPCARYSRQPCCRCPGTAGAAARLPGPSHARAGGRRSHFSRSARPGPHPPPARHSSSPGASAPRTHLQAPERPFGSRRAACSLPSVKRGLLGASPGAPCAGPPGKGLRRARGSAGSAGCATGFPAQHQPNAALGQHTAGALPSTRACTRPNFPGLQRTLRNAQVGEPAGSPDVMPVNQPSADSWVLKCQQPKGS